MKTVEYAYQIFSLDVSSYNNKLQPRLIFIFLETERQTDQKLDDSRGKTNNSCVFVFNFDQQYYQTVLP